MKGADNKLKDSGVIDVDEVTNIAWWPSRPSSEAEWKRFQETGRLKSSLLVDIWPKLSDVERLGEAGSDRRRSTRCRLCSMCRSELNMLKLRGCYSNIQ